jgi:hypothetical protein
MHRFAIPILRLMTHVLNAMARWAGNHPGVIVQFALMLAAAVVVSIATALYLIIRLIV